MPPFDTTEGLKARSDWVDWLIVDRNLTITPEENELIVILKDNLLYAYIEDAIVEFEEALEASRPYTRFRELGWTQINCTQILVRDPERPVMQELTLRKGVIQLMKLQLLARSIPPEQLKASAHYKREVNALLYCVTEVDRLRCRHNTSGDVWILPMLSNTQGLDQKEE